MFLRFPKITGMLNEGTISKTQTSYDEKTILVGAVNRDFDRIKRFCSRN